MRVSVLLFLICLVGAVAAIAQTDTDIGIVTAGNPDTSVPGGDYGEPAWTHDCYEVMIKPLIGATTPGAGITVTVQNSQLGIPPMVIEMEPGDDPIMLHCSWVSAEIEYHPGGPEGGHAGWGVSWTPAVVQTS